jgi:hypothetical protein
MQIQNNPPPPPSDNPQPRRGRQCRVPGEYQCCRIILLVTEARKDSLQNAAYFAQTSVSQYIMRLVDAGEGQ